MSTCLIFVLRLECEYAGKFSMSLSQLQQTAWKVPVCLAVSLSLYPLLSVSTQLFSNEIHSAYPIASVVCLLLVTRPVPSFSPFYLYPLPALNSSRKAKKCPNLSFPPSPGAATTSLSACCSFSFLMGPKPPPDSVNS